MDKSGFTLIESLIYLFLAALSMVLLAQMMSQLQSNARQRIKATRDLLEVAVCLQHCISHFKRAPIRDELWYQTSANALIYQAQEHAIGWFFERNRLVKCTGAWQGAVFRKTSTAVILEGIESARFSVIRDHDIIRSISIEFDYKQKKFKQHVALLLGVIG